MTWLSGLWQRLGLRLRGSPDVPPTAESGPLSPGEAPPVDVDVADLAEPDTAPLRALAPPTGPLPAGMVSEHFSWGEFGCRDGTPVPVELRPNVERLCREHLEPLRAELGRPIRIISGYRTPSWNADRGVGHSQHLTASAADIRIAGVSPQSLHATILRLISLKRIPDGGVGLYLPRPALPPSEKWPDGRPARLVGWVHVDCRGKRARWTG